MYHHSRILDTLRHGMDASAQEQLLSFSNYVAQAYGSEYAAADALISQGRISPQFVHYLFRPGDVLIQRSDDEYRGWIARTWPVAAHQERVLRGSAESRKSGGQASQYRSVKSSDNVRGDTVMIQYYRIEAWNWCFDGNFERKGELIPFSIQFDDHRKPYVAETQNYGSLNTQGVDKKGVNIKDLAVYPLQCADTEIVEKLRKRGKTFWMCRDRHFISYEETGLENVQSSVGFVAQ